MLTTPIVIVCNVKLRFKFFTTKIPFDLLPNFDVDSTLNLLFTTFMLCTTIVFTPMVVIPALSD
jgi:hypothetical protein